MKSILQVALMLSLLTAACTRQTPPPTQAQSSTSNSLAPETTPVDEDDKAVTPLTDEEKRIVEIARKAVAENDDWVERAEFQKPRREADGSWSVMVWRLPKVPGGVRYIDISAEEKVTDYGRGL